MEEVNTGIQLQRGGGGGGLRIHPEVSCQYVKGGVREEGGGGDKKDDDNGYKVNGDKVNGDALQWRAATRNGAGITLAGYNWEVDRDTMSRWWDGWVADSADGRCDFPLVLLTQLMRPALQ